MSAETTGVAPRYGRLTEPATFETMRRVFNRMNRGMVFLWRFGFGWMMDLWPAVFGRLMVIEHVGRRSGRPYRTPVNFTPSDGHVYCLAAFGERTDWYRNLLAQTQAAVWLPDGRWTATASDVTDDPRRLELTRQVLKDSGLAAPLFGLHPRRMSDAELLAATAAYRLVRISPDRPAPRWDGPGDLVWVWPIVGVALILVGRARGRGLVSSR